MPKEPATKEATKPKPEVPEKKAPMTMIEAFIEFQKNLPAIRKDKKGNYGEYSSLDEILSKAKPVLNKFGFGVMQIVYTDDEGANWLQTQLPYILGGMLESGRLKLPSEGVGAQKLGSAITYSKRYQLASFLGVNIDEDDDAQAAQDDAEKSQREGMIADKSARDQYTKFITAVSQKLGIKPRPDLQQLTTADMIAEAQDLKRKFVEQNPQGAPDVEA